MRRCIGCLGLLVALPLAAAPAAPAQQGAQRAKPAPLVTVATPRTVAPVIREDTVDVAIPLRIRRGVRRSEVIVDLRDVVPQGDRPEPGAGGVYLWPKKDSRSRRLGPNMVVRVRFELARVRPGDYTLRLDARRAGGRGGTTRLSVPVKLAAPTVTATANLRVEQVSGPGADRVESLNVREDSSRAAASILGITTRSAESDGGPVAGELDFDLPTEPAQRPRIAPGGRTMLKPTLNGEFPIGTTTGHLDVEIAELDDPVSVAFVVTRRRTRWWLAGALLLGLIAGYFARTQLQRRIETSEAQLAVDSLRAQVAAERDVERETGFQRTADAIIAALTRALEEDDDPAALTKARTEQEAALAKAREELTAVRTALKARIEERSRALTAARALPDAVRKPLADAAAQLKAAADRFARGELTDAQDRVDAADAHLGAAVAAAVAWRDDVLPFVRAAAVAQTVLGEVAATAEGVEAAVRAAATAGETWSATLDAMAAAQTAVDVLRREARDAARAAAAGRPDDAAVQQAVGAAVAAIEEADGRTPGAFSRAADALRGAEAAVAAAAVPDDVELFTFRGVLTSRPSVHRRPAEAWAPGGLVTAPGWSGGLVLVDDGARRRPTRQEWRGTLRRERNRARAIQTFILGLVVLAIGYELFDDAFVGHVEQIVVAFLWAFAADLGFNAVVESARKKGVAPAAPAPAA